MINQNSNFRNLSFSFFSITLLISFFIGENSAGGAKYDHSFMSEFLLLFSQNIKETLLIYEPKTNPHLPFFYIIFGKLLNFISLEILRFFYLLISLTLPIVFYKILKLKFKSSDKNILFIISLLIFLSPYFRSSAVWLTNDNLTLILFCLSIYYFFKSNKFKSKNINHILQCFIYLLLSVYTRQNFILFIFFYLYYLFSNSELRVIFIVLLTNFVLSIPILYYLTYYEHISYYIVNNSLNKTYHLLNIIIFLNLILFYLFPFIISKSIYKKMISILKTNLKKILLLVLFIFFVHYYILDYSNYVQGFGGGAFYKLFINILNIPELLVLFSIISLVLLFCFLDKKVSNYIIIILLFFLYPLPVLFQKYYDPLLIIVLFSLLSFDKDININFLDKKYVVFPTIYFSSFYLFALYYYS
tara:strand:- start:1186 stop:2430 length:1245 start_codon:yes stop_codon:yes gene_type:complete